METRPSPPTLNIHMQDNQLLVRLQQQLTMCLTSVVEGDHVVT